jgi:N-acetyl-gamma-glutamyl-phosphate reductase
MLSSFKTPVSVSIIGGSGYTGAELIRLISKHPHFTLNQVVANRNAGKKIQDIFPHLRHLNLPDFISFEQMSFENVDLIFCALPHATSQEIILKIPEDKKIIDLSADFRLERVEEYEKWYGSKHIATSLQEKAIYGLTEIYKEKIKKGSLIACTGCNSAATLYPVLPLLNEGIINCDNLTINLGAGVSGAGRDAKQNIIHSEVSEGVKPYNIGRHRHIAELEQEFKKATNNKFDITFIPHLLPQNRGVLVSIPIDSPASIVHKTLEEFYNNAPFIIILPIEEIPATQHVRGSNFCHIGVISDHNKDRSVVISVLDNLIKGSAGQAIQNANIMFDFDETSGLLESPIFP